MFFRFTERWKLSSQSDKNNDTEAGMFCVSHRVILSELKAFPMRSKLRGVIRKEASDAVPPAGSSTQQPF
jgi:hypothetical protein